MKYVESGSDYSHSVGYEYDTVNNLTKLVETINGVKHTTTYTYDEDNRVSSVTDGTTTRTYSYDEFGRQEESQTTHNGTPVLTQTVTYSAGSTRPELLELAMPSRTHTYFYTYDDNGNILAIYEGVETTRSTGSGSADDYCIAAYTYDSANQLIREDNQMAGKTWVWTYDSAGNILSRKEYAYTTEPTEDLGTPASSVSYVYGSSVWGDLLTVYNRKRISYDPIGNPLNDGTWTYTWQHGRELASMTNGVTTWTYTYDANGMRTFRSNGTDTYTYVYNGDKLVQMTKGSETLYFSYDANGTPLSFTYEGSTFYYVTNLQGDVVAILNANGMAIASYYYDAWGNDIDNRHGGLGQLNPLRYRGYVYDTETGLYYLQSRYYNPETGRFLNADGYMATGQGLLGNNMFAYCNNNPVRYCDPSGDVLIEALVVAVGTEWAITIVVGGIVIISGVVYKAIETFVDWLSRQWYRSCLEITYVAEQPKDPDVTYPGDDPAKAPEGTEWKGKGEQGSNRGNYHNPETGESWHPDLDHPEPIGPHWDYRDPSGIWWRIGPGNIISLK